MRKDDSNPNVSDYDEANATDRTEIQGMVTMTLESRQDARAPLAGWEFAQTSQGQDWVTARNSVAEE